MDGLRLRDTILQDPVLRNNLEQAQTVEQRIAVLQKNGFSQPAIQNLALSISDLAKDCFCEGSGPCKA